ncbi:MAG: hypothetical protein M3O09_15205 [Acidobacteriota bacterium]|nr:hypothetical protein [Acidobacteriota bacterium]
MSDPLATYLHDHLAGAAYAVDLVEFMRDQHQGEELGQFAAGLLIDIKSDQDVLRRLARRVGVGSSKLKELTAWLGEKVSRLKLRHDAADGLGLFEALEFLELGIHGKLELWRALGAIAPNDSRLQSVSFEGLADRAEKQRVNVEKRRLEVAHRVFGLEDNGARRTRNVGTHGPSSRVKVGKSAGKTAIAGVMLAVAVIVSFELAPDIVRYMKMRAM